MSKIVLLRGLPCSGKTLEAAKLVAQGYKRVSYTDLSTSLDNGIYSRDNQKFIEDIGESITVLALQSGINIVLDNYNLDKYYVSWAKAICREFKAQLEIVHLDTPVSTCVTRDLDRTSGRVGKDLIMKLYNKYYIDGKLHE